MKTWRVLNWHVLVGALIVGLMAALSVGADVLVAICVSGLTVCVAALLLIMADVMDGRL